MKHGGKVLAKSEVDLEYIHSFVDMSSLRLRTLIGRRQVRARRIRSRSDFSERCKRG